MKIVDILRSNLVNYSCCIDEALDLMNPELVNDQEILEQTQLRYDIKVPIDKYYILGLIMLTLAKLTEHNDTNTNPYSYLSTLEYGLGIPILIELDLLERSGDKLRFINDGCNLKSCIGDILKELDI